MPDEIVKTFCPFAWSEKANVCQSNCGLAIEGLTEDGEVYYQCAIEIIALSLANLTQSLCNLQGLIDELGKGKGKNIPGEQ